MTTELYWLTLTALMTALLWVPYILNRIAVRGLADAMGYPTGEVKPHSPWAERALAAHKNAVENLVVFATLVVAANVAGVSSGVTEFAAMAYFFLRLAHYLCYMFAIPVVRTLTFAGGWACQVAIAFAILGIV
ncbi:MAG: MAPEG family protein [Pseudomonadota bacterium]